MFVNETKNIYQPFSVGEKVETKVVRGPLSGSWIPARVMAVNTQCQTLELCLLNSEKYKVKKTASKVPMSSVRRVKSRFKIGDSVATKISRGKIEGIWIPARVVGVNDDDTYDLFVEEGDTWKVEKHSTSVPGTNLKSVIALSVISSDPLIFNRRLDNRPTPPSVEFLDLPRAAEKLPLEPRRLRRSRSTPRSQFNHEPSLPLTEPLDTPNKGKNLKIKVKNKKRHGRSAKSKRWRIKRSNSRKSKLGRSLSQPSSSQTPKNIFSPFRLFGSSPKRSDGTNRWSWVVFSSRRSKSLNSTSTPPCSPALRGRKSRIATLQRSESASSLSNSPPPLMLDDSNPLRTQSQNNKGAQREDSPKKPRVRTSPNWNTPVTLEDFKDEVNFDDSDDVDQSVTGSNTQTVSNWEDLYEWPNEDDDLIESSEDRRVGITLEDLTEESEEGSEMYVPHELDKKEEPPIPRFSSELTESGWGDALSRLPLDTRPSIISPLKVLVEDLDPILLDEPRISHRTCNRQDEPPNTHRQRQASTSSRKTLSTKNATDLSSAMVASSCQTPVSQDLNNSVHDWPDSVGNHKDLRDSGKLQKFKSNDGLIDRKRNTESHHARISTVGVSKHKIKYSELDLDTPLSKIASWLGEDSNRDGDEKFRQQVKSFSFNNTTIPIHNEGPLKRARSQPLAKGSPSVYSLSDILGQKSLDSSKGLAFFVGPVDGKMSYKMSICDVDNINSMSRCNSFHPTSVKSAPVLRIREDNEVNIRESQVNSDEGDSLQNLILSRSV
jgi:hypothetical protein